MKVNCKLLLFVLLPFWLASSMLIAQDNFVLRLDKLMTTQEQERTGIKKLTKSEREALELWLTNWTLEVLAKAKSSSGQTYVGVGGDHWVSKNIDSGRFIKLEDGSLWQISPIDRINTMLWLVVDEITVVESNNPLYPFKLINTDNGDTAEAKLVSQ